MRAAAPGNAEPRSRNDEPARVDPVRARDRLDADSVAARNRGERFPRADPVHPGRAPARGRAPGAGRQGAQQPGRSASDDAVRQEPLAPLKAADGTLGLRAETAVEPARAQAAAREQELEHADVVARPAAPDHARPEQRAAAGPERCSRTRAGQSVDGEAVASLKDADGPPRLRPLHAVDRSPVEPVLLEHDLQPGGLGVERLRSRYQGQCGQKGRDENDQAPHPKPVGAEARVSCP